MFLGVFRRMPIFGWHWEQRLWIDDFVVVLSKKHGKKSFQSNIFDIYFEKKALIKLTFR